MNSYVTLEQHICPVCTVTFDTGNLLLDQRLKERFEHHTTTGWSLCPECQKLTDDDYVHLVAYSNACLNPKLKPEEADRTGTIIRIKRAAFEQIFNTPAVKNMAFIDKDVVTMLQKRYQEDTGQILEAE